jgi:hypothetical protein
MKKSDLYHALRTELHRHDFSTFVDEPPSVAQGGRGVVVPGCPACKKRFSTMPQFMDHLTDDVLPAVLDRLSAEKTMGARVEPTSELDIKKRFQNDASGVSMLCSHLPQEDR